MLYLSTYHKLSLINSYDNYKDSLFLDIKYMELFNKCTVNIDCIGDLIQLANCWPMIGTEVEKHWSYSYIQEILQGFLLDNQNSMDTIDKLIVYPFLDMEDGFIQTVLEEAVMELSNVRYWKYSLVENPIYYRKIHNSFHYSTPYILLYCLSKLQAAHSLLPDYAEATLEKVIFDGYSNLDQLSVLDIGLLLASTPKKNNHLVTDAIDACINQIEQHDFQAIPFYYDNLFFETNFIGSATFTAAVVLEALLTAGNFQWKPFVSSGHSCAQSLSTNYLEIVGSCDSPRICRMKMKEHCMAPFLNEGDEIDVSYDFGDIAVDDIVVFRHYSNRVMAHRVIDVVTNGKKRALITAADNGGLWGYPAFKRDIIGKVVKIYKHE